MITLAWATLDQSNPAKSPSILPYAAGASGSVTIDEDSDSEYIDNYVHFGSTGTTESVYAVVTYFPEEGSPQVTEATLSQRLGAGTRGYRFYLPDPGRVEVTFNYDYGFDPAIHTPVKLVMEFTTGADYEFPHSLTWYSEPHTPPPPLEPNVPPVAVNDSVSVAYNGSVVIDVLANDTDSDGTLSTSVQIASGPTKGTAAANSDGTITYTCYPGSVGSDSFSYRCYDDRGDSSQATVSVTIVGGPVNIPPVAADMSAAAVQGAQVRIEVMDAVSDADGLINGLSLEITQPAFGTASASLGGVYYTSNSDFAGTDSFSFRVADTEGAFSNWAECEVVVSPRPPDPEVPVDNTGNIGDTSGALIAWGAAGYEGGPSGAPFTHSNSGSAQEYSLVAGQLYFGLTTLGIAASPVEVRHFYTPAAGGATEELPSYSLDPYIYPFNSITPASGYRQGLHELVAYVAGVRGPVKLMCVVTLEADYQVSDWYGSIAWYAEAETTQFWTRLVNTVERTV